MNSLDYSEQNKSSEDLVNSQYASKSDIGTLAGSLKPIEVDFNEQEDFVEENKTKSKSKQNGTKQSSLFGSLKSMIGGKVMTKETIEPIMEKMHEHLVGS